MAGANRATLAGNDLKAGLIVGKGGRPKKPTSFVESDGYAQFYSSHTSLRTTAWIRVPSCGVGEHRH
jgi:hypothetical protein